MTEVKAHNRYLRMSPRKVRLVVDIIRGMDAEPALAQLTYMSKAAARPVRKLLQSAIANAEHNNKIKSDNLFVKKATVDQGPTIKRFRPRAMGASAAIRKRTSHVTLVLAPKVEPKKEVKAEKKEEKAEKKAAPVKKEEKTEKKPTAKKAAKPAAKPATKKAAPKKAEASKKPATKKPTKK